MNRIALYEGMTVYDVIDGFYSGTYSILPERYRELLDCINYVLKSISGTTITDCDVRPIVYCVDEYNDTREFASLLNNYIEILGIRLRYELDGGKKHHHKMESALSRLKTTICSSVREIFSYLIEEENVKIVAEGDERILKLVISSTHIYASCDLDEIIPYIESVVDIDASRVFYTPPKEKKGCFGSLFSFFSKDKSLLKYREEIKEWLPAQLEVLLDNQPVIGRSRAIASFLRKYCKLFRKLRSKAIVEERMPNLYVWRWIALILSILIIILGAIIWLYGTIYFSVADMFGEIDTPRYPYLPAEIATVYEQTENMWVFQVFRYLGYVLLGIWSLDFLIAERKVFLPCLSNWLSYFKQRLVILNYVLNINKRNSIFIIILTLVVSSSAILYWKTGEHVGVRTKEDVLNVFAKLSPTEGAKYYYTHRNSFVFIDSLYGEKVFPALETCDYFELKQVYQILKSTSYSAQLKDWLGNKRPAVLAHIKQEIAENEEIELQTIDEEVLPALNLELDSLIEDNMDDIFESYAGGVMNYKKLAFFMGRNSTEFVNLFNKDIALQKYEKCAKDYAQNYIYIVNFQQSKYCSSLTGKPFSYKANIVMPKSRVNLNKQTITFIKDYTRDEKFDMAFFAIRDFAVPMVIGAATGGLGYATYVYDAATLTYDVAQAFNSNEISKDDMVKFMCEDDVAQQINNHYMLCVRKQLINHVKLSNKKLCDQVLKDL